MNTINKNSTNADLYAEFTADILNDGKTRIFAVSETKNKAYRTVFLCQSVKRGNATTSTQNFFLGWEDTRLVRAIHNADTKIAAKFKIGQVVPFDILIKEAVSPAYEGQSPKINPQTGEVIQFNGLDIYEHGNLVEVGRGGIVRLEEQKAAIITATEQPVKEVVQNNILEKAGN